MRPVAVALAAVVVLVLLLPIASASSPVAPSASLGGSTISPYNPGGGSASGCPSSGLLPGLLGADGALVAFWQPNLLEGGDCALEPGGTVIGDQVIIGLYTPVTPTDANVPITVVEYQLQTVTVLGPDNTTMSQEVPYDMSWSNTSVGATAGEIQLFELTVPSAQTGTWLQLSLAGVNQAWSISTPPLLEPIPLTLAGLLAYTVAVSAAIVIAFAASVPVAMAIVYRVSYPKGLRKWGIIALLAAAGFAEWAYSSYPSSLYVLGSVNPYVVPSVLAFLGGLYLWIAALPRLWPLSHRVGIRSPIARLVDGRKAGRELIYRIRTDANGRTSTGLEWVSERPWASAWRLLGVRDTFNPNVISDVPTFVANADYESSLHDVRGWYYTWADRPGAPPVVEDVRPHVWWLPWRKSAREQREKWLRELGRDPASVRYGLLWSVDGGEVRIRAVTESARELVEGWVIGTVKSSEVGEELVKTQRLNLRLRSSGRQRAWHLARQIIAQRTGDDFASGRGEDLDALEAKLDAELEASFRPSDRAERETVTEEGPTRARARAGTKRGARDVPPV